MIERRSKKISILIFLFGIFVLLVVVTAGWLYSMYSRQIAYSEEKTLDTIECGRYYFSIDERSVVYENGTLYFEIKNTLGSQIDTLVISSSTEKKEVDVYLTQGAIYPVSVPIQIIEWVLVHPKGCGGVNFQNLSFMPNTT